jgi:hypothetical protein
MTSVNISSTQNTVLVSTGASGTVVTVATVGPQGPQGPAGSGGGGGGTAYEFVQGSAATTWTINHNLGYKPIVDVYDTGSQQIEAAVTHPTINQTLILLTAPAAGFARLT